MEVGPFDFAPLMRDCSERVFLVVVSVLDIVDCDPFGNKDRTAGLGVELAVEVSA